MTNTQAAFLIDLSFRIAANDTALADSAMLRRLLIDWLESLVYRGALLGYKNESYETTLAALTALDLPDVIFP